MDLPPDLPPDLPTNLPPRLPRQAEKKSFPSTRTIAIVVVCFAAVLVGYQGIAHSPLAAGKGYPTPSEFVSRWNDLVDSQSLHVTQIVDPDGSALKGAVMWASSGVIDLGDVLQTRQGIVFSSEDRSYAFWAPNGYDHTEFGMGNICPLLIQSVNPSIDSDEAKLMYKSAGRQYHESLGSSQEGGADTENGIRIEVTNGPSGGYVCSVHNASK